MNMSSNDEKSLKLRVLGCSDTLPSDYIKVICDALPEFDNPVDKTKISNVKRTVISDERITDILEIVSAEYQNMIARIRELTSLQEAS